MFDVIVRTYYCSFLGKKKKSQNIKNGFFPGIKMFI